MSLSKSIRYVLLALFIWSFPSFLLAYLSPTLGAISSYLSMGLLIVLMFVEKEKGAQLPAFIILALLYFLLSGLNFQGDSEGELYFFIDFVKVLLVVSGGTILLRKSTLKELFIFLLIGALSIVINAVFFPLENANYSPTYGRFSGFYLNPNYAGAVCIAGFALSFGIKNKKLKYIGQIIFSIAGFFTLSRYFILIWVMLNLLSILISRKNLIVPVLGAFGLIFLVAFGDKLPLNTERFLAFTSVFNDKEVDTKTLQEDSRGDTWASYFEAIYEKPFLGHGYKKFQTRRGGLPGVHNTYLMVIGEAGFIPFLLIVAIYLSFLFKGYKRFKTEPHKGMLAIVLSTALLVWHNYFDQYVILLLSIYLYIAFKEKTSNQQTIPKKELSR